MGRPAIFLDRDGTLNVSHGYVNHEARFRLYPFAVDAIRLVRSQDYLAVVITNQSGVGRGLYAESLVGRVHAELNATLEAAGTRLDGLYYCPHDPGQGCPCRKPAPGMILQAQHELDIDLERSYMIGDAYSDLRAGWAAGTRTGLVLTGFGRGNYEYQRDQWDRQPDLVGETVIDLLGEIFWGGAA